MKELHDIIKAYEAAVVQQKKTALATVVKVEGSSYRRPGARMLVTEDGNMIGAISGGCLEGDALRKAKLALMQQQNKLVIYDTLDEDDAKMGIQLGCNGIVYILFEPVDAKDENNPIALLKKMAAFRRPGVLVTVFNENKHAEQKGTRCFITEDETLLTLNNCEAMQTEGNAVLQQKQSVVKSNKNESILYQYVSPMVQLVIAGAGNDVQPLVEMASVLGWHTTVVDGRSTHATAQRFSKANAVLVAKPEQVLLQCKTDAQTAFVLMTHNYNYDLALLSNLLTLPCAYIGVLGPLKKMQRMLDELQEKGIVVNKHCQTSLHGPVGLDIGAETAEEIALSILAEIKAVFADRNGTFLRNRQDGIHTRPALLPTEAQQSAPQ